MGASTSNRGGKRLLVANVNHQYLDDAMEVTCIEPYPRAFLEHGIPGIKRRVREKVQDVPLTEFERLEAGDVLFVDSSHVAKTGSDVATR
jgi:hypothetical protein